MKEECGVTVPETIPPLGHNEVARMVRCYLRGAGVDLSDLRVQEVWGARVYEFAERWYLSTDEDAVMHGWDTVFKTYQRNA